ncbi:hypothetical protein [Flavihumibacter fluminis]|uniref:hypothetical protein n=1 Tax=Flavihumibacter fluminis TaxID=2909236 RepID=UPI001F430534|nr:hypothetical protein [Flavihumibacter fluminis]
MVFNLLTPLHKRSWPALILIVILSSACFIQSSCVTTAPYDQYVYKESTSLKVDALKLMDKAEKTYNTQEKEIEKLTDQLDKLYEYELHRKKNQLRIQMWELLRNPEKNLLGGFLSRWKKEGQLSPGFITEAKIIVGKAFDQLAELESGKLTPKELQQ